MIFERFIVCFFKTFEQKNCTVLFRLIINLQEFLITRKISYRSGFGLVNVEHFKGGHEGGQHDKDLGNEALVFYDPLVGHEHGHLEGCQADGQSRPGGRSFAPPDVRATQKLQHKIET